ncbi:NAD(P)H-binding protein [Amycolatopsis nigrescens]|uniref:NAD(P)H-binding protein n=1 Tax=Amycolatopsis nigrescens TaxID=381445 RepID=UPI000366B24B|nr:NAD(P)H-binding protein [Amycolatopsis nigrescens]
MANGQHTLVIGATGNVGGEVVVRLRESDAPVRALVRDPAGAALPDGVRAIKGDVGEPSTVEEAAVGAGRVFVVWPMRPPEEMGPLVDIFVRQGVRRIVLLSSAAVRDDVEEQDNPIGVLHAALERPIERSGLEWTFLRPHTFAANTRLWADAIRSEGVVRDAHGAAGMTLIHEKDIAAVAVRALTEDGHAGEKYELSGPETITQVEQVRTIGEVTGRPARWEEIPREQARRQLVSRYPAEVADLMLDGYARMVDEPVRPTAVVEKVTGVPARTYREWVADHVGEFR